MCDRWLPVDGEEDAVGVLNGTQSDEDDESESESRMAVPLSPSPSPKPPKPKRGRTKKRTRSRSRSSSASSSSSSPSSPGDSSSYSASSRSPSPVYAKKRAKSNSASPPQQQIQSSTNLLETSWHQPQDGYLHTLPSHLAYESTSTYNYPVHRLSPSQANDLPKTISSPLSLYSSPSPNTSSGILDFAEECGTYSSFYCDGVASVPSDSSPGDAEDTTDVVSFLNI
eukprot:TRINITY_DN2220_c0_g4_i1.p1 TRINITY_DN2220_c0_g4~~TRINITY_DN2220_c0_g4_i1.p1  ORF type:complete len:226 (-),score=50.17 TRINITY_DN2220_c0_g4_i1:112-789(-)